MKRMMLISMLGILLFSDTVFANVPLVSNASPTGVWIKFIFNFHRPKLNCESGFGICFDIEWGFVDFSAPSAPKGCVVKGQVNELGQLVMEVSESDLMKYENGSTLPYFKNKNIITIVDPYTLSVASCKSLGMSSQFTIRPGDYPVTYKGGVYTVVFRP